MMIDRIIKKIPTPRTTVLSVSPCGNKNDGQKKIILPLIILPQEGIYPFKFNANFYRNYWSTPWDFDFFSKKRSLQWEWTSRSDSISSFQWDWALVWMKSIIFFFTMRRGASWDDTEKKQQYKLREPQCSPHILVARILKVSPAFRF